ncbi:MAG: hypothetical protein MSC31_15165 [Solirubrobacteraceae bacterium MAG38_C4-C5]|nr:hypothetical protein [Candidatus Siliceabacter maunaloa]
MTSLDEAITGAHRALAGDSNDAEHEALGALLAALEARAAQPHPTPYEASVEDCTDALAAYRVTWRIDLDARSPRDAAVRALAIQRAPQSIAVVFEVAADGGPGVAIDLLEERAAMSAASSSPQPSADGGV